MRADGNIYTQSVVSSDREKWSEAVVPRMCLFPVTMSYFGPSFTSWTTLTSGNSKCLVSLANLSHSVKSYITSLWQPWLSVKNWTKLTKKRIFKFIYMVSNHNNSYLSVLYCKAKMGWFLYSALNNMPCSLIHTSMFCLHLSSNIFRHPYSREWTDNTKPPISGWPVLPRKLQASLQF